MLTRRVLLTGAASCAIACAVGAPRVRAEADELRILDLFRLEVGPTDRARALEGERIRLTGFMAPPLRADAQFFVLTESPMPLCPFCDSEGEWPESIIPIYTDRRIEVAPFYKRIEVEGRLAIGVLEDPATGFVSPMRLERASYSVI